MKTDDVLPVTCEWLKWVGADPDPDPLLSGDLFLTVPVIEPGRIPVVIRFVRYEDREWGVFLNQANQANQANDDGTTPLDVIAMSGFRSDLRRVDVRCLYVALGGDREL